MISSRLTLLKSHEVDHKKWDDCIRNSSNGLIYSTSTYLNLMTEKWNAIIVDDYAAVFPLPWKQKFFIPYYYYVPFLAQAGITGYIDASLFTDTTRLMFRNIKYGDLMLNFGNAEYANFLKATPLVNMVLDLDNNYEIISSGYHDDLIKNLKKTLRSELIYSEEKDFRLALDLYKKEYGSRMRSLKKKDFERFTALCYHLALNKNVIVRKVTDGKGELLAIVLLLKDERRLYNLMNTVLPEGRKTSANHFLMDNVIREFSGNSLLLDFEGSDITGIRSFYENFGARNEGSFWVRRRVW